MLSATTGSRRLSNAQRKRAQLESVRLSNEKERRLREQAQIKRRRVRDRRLQRVVEADRRHRAGRALLFPFFIFFSLGTVLTLCSWVEPFGKDTLFWEPRRRRLSQVVGIVLLGASALTGLSMYLLYKSIRTGRNREALAALSTTDSPMNSDTSQDTKDDVTTASVHQRENKAYQRSVENNIEKLGQPTYYFPPVEIHAWDIHMWDLKCSGKLLEEARETQSSVDIRVQGQTSLSVMQSDEMKSRSSSSVVIESPKSKDPGCQDQALGSNEGTRTYTEPDTVNVKPQIVVTKPHGECNAINSPAQCPEPTASMDPLFLRGPDPLKKRSITDVEIRNVISGMDVVSSGDLDPEPLGLDDVKLTESLTRSIGPSPPLPPFPEIYSELPVQ